MIEHSNKTGESVDSVYLRGQDAVLEHERRNGYDKAWGPTGVAQMAGNQNQVYLPDGSKQVLV